MMAAARGPAWLGIGAQRSGTTWFTDLLVQHPQVRLAPNGRKEQHHLTLALGDGWGEHWREPYLDMFVGDDRPGEFTPAYLRSLWVPGIAAEVVREDAPIIALLRDPVERFESSLRRAAALGTVEVGSPSTALRKWVRTYGSSVQWMGMYATQLAAWARVFARERLHVLQYEALLPEPRPAVESVWTAMGLDPVALERVDEPSRHAVGGTQWHWDLLPGFREQLRAAYEPEVRRVVDEWGIDRALWPNFA